MINIDTVNNYPKCALFHLFLLPVPGCPALPSLAMGVRCSPGREGSDGVGVVFRRAQPGSSLESFLADFLAREALVMGKLVCISCLWLCLGGRLSVWEGSATHRHCRSAEEGQGSSGLCFWELPASKAGVVPGFCSSSKSHVQPRSKCPWHSSLRLGHRPPLQETSDRA